MLVVDGSFEEHIDELATFIDSLSKEESKVQEKVEECLQEDDKETAITAVVESSHVLGNASEKDYEPAHNLFIHILLASDDLSKHITTVLSNITRVPDFTNAANVTYNILTTLYNVVPTQHRLPIFKATLKICKDHELYEVMASRFKDMPKLLKAWNASPEESRDIYVMLAELHEAADERQSEFLIRAVETFSNDDGSKEVTVKAVNVALNEEERLSFDDLLVLPPVKGLQKSSPAHFELLELLSNGSFADYKSFASSKESFFTENAISQSTLEHKFKVLTIASLAARQDNRKLRYGDVAAALEIPEAEVEMWIIETIKSGLIEGKLSQPSSLFLVHRATYRTFEHEQWEEVSAKLASWKESLQEILIVIDGVKNDGGNGQPNGFAGDLDDEDDEARSQASDVPSVDPNAD